MHAYIHPYIHTSIHPYIHTSIHHTYTYIYIHFGSSHFGSSHFGSRLAQASVAVVGAMPAPWLLLLALLHALHYKLRWRWRCAGLIERLHEIGGLLEIRTTSCLALNRGVSQHFGKVDYTKVSSLDMVMSFVWVLGWGLWIRLRACLFCHRVLRSLLGGCGWGRESRLLVGFACCGEFDGVITASCLGSVGRPRFPGRFVVLRSPVVGLVGGGFSLSP